MEAALERRREELGIPNFRIDLSGAGDLPPHVPSSLSSLQFPHRHADAYLRDAELADGTPFLKSEYASAVYSASARNPAAIYQWFPASFVFGFWQSHLGKKGPQTKFARAVDCEIVGYDPASVETKRLGIKGDPLNLSITEAVIFDADDHTEWDLAGSGKTGKSKSKESLAEIGHGQVPVSANDAPLGAISFAWIEQRCTVSFARFRTIDSGNPQADAAGRAMLASLGLVAYVSAFSGGFTLRSGCDLRTASAEWRWLGETGDAVCDALSLDEAIDLFHGASRAAADLGLPVGPRWNAETVDLLPKPALLKAIRQTFGLA
jgi:CRISPR-associated protein Csb1